jgi:hypothetical protein
MESFTRRVDYYQSNIFDLGFKFWIVDEHFFCRRGDKEYTVFYSIDFCIVPSIGNSLFYDFYSDKFFSESLLEERNSDTSCSTIQI